MEEKREGWLGGLLRTVYKHGSWPATVGTTAAPFPWHYPFSFHFQIEHILPLYSAAESSAA